MSEELAHPDHALAFPRRASESCAWSRQTRLLPFGSPGQWRIFAGTYLSEFGTGWLPRTLRFVNDTLGATPSIVAGLFAYTLIVVRTHRVSAFAGNVALAVLMIPTITRTAEEMLHLVPRTLRPLPRSFATPILIAAFAAGCGSRSGMDGKDDSGQDAAGANDSAVAQDEPTEQQDAPTGRVAMPDGGGSCGGQTCQAGSICCGPPECGICIGAGSGRFCGFTCDAGSSEDGGSPADGGWSEGGGPPADSGSCQTNADCGADRLCVAYRTDRGPTSTTTRTCKANPCGPSALSCSCAASLCSGFGRAYCSVSSGNVTCDDGGV